MIGVVFSATIRDGFGTSASTRAYFAANEAAALSDLETIFADWLTRLDATTDGVIENWKMTLVPSRAAITDLSTALKTDFSSGAGAQCRVELAAMFNFTATGTSRKWAQVVPAFTTDALVGDRVDLTNSAVEALVAQLLGEDSTGNHTNEVNQAIAAFRDVFLGTHKYRKQLQRSSFEV